MLAKPLQEQGVCGWLSSNLVGLFSRFARQSSQSASHDNMNKRCGLPWCVHTSAERPPLPSPPPTPDAHNFYQLSQKIGVLVRKDIYYLGQRKHAGMGWPCAVALVPTIPDRYRSQKGASFKIKCSSSTVSPRTDTTSVYNTNKTEQPASFLALSQVTIVQ